MTADDVSNTTVVTVLNSKVELYVEETTMKRHRDVTGNISVLRT